MHCKDGLLHREICRRGKLSSVDEHVNSCWETVCLEPLTCSRLPLAALSCPPTLRLQEAVESCALLSQLPDCVRTMDPHMLLRAMSRSVVLQQLGSVMLSMAVLAQGAI